MKKVGIVGFGRFGRVLYKLLKDDFSLVIYDKLSFSKSLAIGSKIVFNPAQLYEEVDTVFYAVPISEFEKMISSHSKYFETRHILVDVLSVKKHSADIFKKYLKLGTRAMLTHPMFGPDSSGNGFKGLTIVLDRFTAPKESFVFWKRFFLSKGLKVVEMSPEEHDKLAANSQGLTHFIGRLLGDYGISETKIDTLGTKKLLEVKDQTCKDSWQLFSDLQHYNPYAKFMRKKLSDKYDALYNKLLSKAVNPPYLTFGIQGGKGSFNEEAVMYYVNRSGIKNYKIKYLFTSNSVLRSLSLGEIDQGQFAIHNSTGGLVGESIEAMAAYKFKIVDQFSIKISHSLMIRQDAELADIKEIMAHPQVFAQCKNSLEEKYPGLKKISGEGKMIDHALVAKELGGLKLPKNIATMGSKVLADIYNLKIVEEDLQDVKDNYTTFLQVRRS